MNANKTSGEAWPLGALFVALGLLLLAVVDFRRGFLFSKSAYLYKSTYIVFSPWQLALVLFGLVGMYVFRRKLTQPNIRGVNITLLGIFLLLLLDAGLYRGVAAARAMTAGSISLDWLRAFGTGGLIQPLALCASYVLTVWHATVLSCLGAGLALLALPRLLRGSMAQLGWRGSVVGAAYAFTQPFCSCCAALTAPGLFRSGQSMNFAVAVLLGAPLMNISTLILAGNLLPWPFATLRILGGILTTVALSFFVSPWLGARLFESREHRMASELDINSPSAVVTSWLKLSLRIALILVPSMIVGTVLSSVVWSLWPTGLGNSVTSVVVTALIGSLVMVSTWSEIPLASQMIQQGMTGPAAAALLALPAVNLGSLLIVGTVSRNWKIAVGLALGVVVISTSVGIGFL